MTQKALSPWTCLFFPSIKDILFLCFLLSPNLLIDASVLSDSDTGWHIRNGENILSTMTLPYHDYFSHTAYGKPWFAWEWLSDVLMACIHRFSGLNGIVIWANLIYALTFTLLFVWMVRRGENLMLSLLFSGLAGFTSALHWLARPHLFTMFLVLIWMMALEKIQRSGAFNGRITYFGWCFFPPLMMLWTNLHGGFVVGLILLGIYSLGNWLSSWTSVNPNRNRQAILLARHFAWLTFFCSLMTLINPYGIRLHEHIFKSYFHSHFLVDNIVEFLSPNFHHLPDRLFEIILLSSILILAISWRRLTFIESGLIMFWTYMALFSVRHIPLYLLAIVPMLVNHLSEYCQRMGDSLSIRPRISKAFREFNQYASSIGLFEKSFKGFLYPIVASLLLVGIALNHGSLNGQQIIKAEFDPRNFPVKASQFLEYHTMEGNLFSTDQWGGYLIYRHFPRYKVFFDGRSDMYGEDFIKKYQKVTGLSYDWKSVLNEFDVKWFLLPTQDGLASALKESKEWKVIYDDHTAIIFIQRENFSPL